MSTGIVVKSLPFLHFSASLSLMTCIQVPWLQQIASCGKKSPRPPVYESLDWTSPNALWWNIALGNKPQVEIVTAFSILAEEKFGRLDSYLHFHGQNLISRTRGSSGQFQQKTMKILQRNVWYISKIICDTACRAIYLNTKLRLRLKDWLI